MAAGREMGGAAGSMGSSELPAPLEEPWCPCACPCPCPCPCPCSSWSAALALLPRGGCRCGDVAPPPALEAPPAMLCPWPWSWPPAADVLWATSEPAEAARGAWRPLPLLTGAAAAAAAAREALGALPVGGSSAGVEAIDLSECTLAALAPAGVDVAECKNGRPAAATSV